MAPGGAPCSRCKGQLLPAQRAPCEPANIFIARNNRPILRRRARACCCLLLGLFYLFIAPSSLGSSSSHPAPSPPPALLLPGRVRVRARPEGPTVLSSSPGAFSCSAVTNSPGPNPASSKSRGLCPSICRDPGHGQTLPSSTRAVSPPQTCREQVQNSPESVEVPCTPGSTASHRHKQWDQGKGVPLGWGWERGGCTGDPQPRSAGTAWGIAPPAGSWEPAKGKARPHLSC